MTPEQFVYWLKGYSEISTVPPSAAQWKFIREKLNETTPHIPPEIKLEPKQPPLHYPPGVRGDKFNQDQYFL